VSPQEAGIAAAADEFRDHYRDNEDPLNDAKIASKIAEVIQVPGAVAWFIHNAVRRNYDRQRKGDYIVPEIKGVC